MKSEARRHILVWDNASASENIDQTFLSNAIGIVSITQYVNAEAIDALGKATILKHDLSGLTDAPRDGSSIKSRHSLLVITHLAMVDLK